MAAIKKLAVRAENILVARVELHNTQQDRNEPIRNYAALLRGQANICKFTVTCPTCAVDINYTEQVLRDITRGLADHEIQLDLLGDKNQNMSLDEVIQFIEAKEAGKRSAGRLQGTQSINATHSQYRKSKQDRLKSQRSTHKDTCSYCGQHGHGKRAPTSIRRNTCPAYGKHADIVADRTISRLSVSRKQNLNHHRLRRIMPLTQKVPFLIPSAIAHALYQ